MLSKFFCCKCGLFFDVDRCLNNSAPCPKCKNSLNVVKENHPFAKLVVKK